MIPVPKNQLQVKFNQEKQQLEKYGHVSSLTFEEWLTVKGYVKNRKEMTREEQIENEAIDYSEIEDNFMEYDDCGDVCDDRELIEKAFIQGAEWADETMIDKICKLLKDSEYSDCDGVKFKFNEDYIENVIRKAMEE